MTTGLMVRAGVRVFTEISASIFFTMECMQIVGNVFRKSLRASGRSRLEHSVGQITTMISTDATRLDHFAIFGHKCVLYSPLFDKHVTTFSLWVSPIQVQYRDFFVRIIEDADFLIV